MQLIIVSGRSGSGKSTALHALEDSGYNCIDNFPVALLQSLVHNAVREPAPGTAGYAVCIDARNANLERFPEILLALDRIGVDCQVIYLDALSPTLVRRFSETRRRHPLSNAKTDLTQAIDDEAQILASIADLADWTIDTTLLSSQELVDLIRNRVADKRGSGLSLMFRSFGFKHGVPLDADMVFDVRCLPNPHWIDELRPLTGRDDDVIDYLDAQPLVDRMFTDIRVYLERWLPHFIENNRVYLTVAIGCTGGQHRSVYMAERLARHFTNAHPDTLVRHRQLDDDA